VGEFFSVFGIFKGLMFRVMEFLKIKEPVSYLRNGVANTSIVDHQDLMFALNEVNLPFRIRIEESGEFVEIASEDFFDYGGQLKHQSSAHSKHDPETGEFMCFGYDVEYKLIYYSLFDRHQKLLSKMEIPMATPVMIHDFPATSNFVVFPVNPIEFNPFNFLLGKYVFTFNPQSLSRYGVMRRHNN
jgi:9-cis-epoxycarotenoid dioxygenase